MPTKKNTITLYELYAYFKQGDDFNHQLNSSKTVSEALLKWAEMLTSSAVTMRDLASRFKGTTIDSNSDTHSVVFEAQTSKDEKILSKAVQDELLSATVLDCDD